MIDDAVTNGAPLEVTRSIPVPTSVSAEAQRALAGGADLIAASASAPYPALDDPAGWRAYIEFADSMLLGMFESQAAQFAGTVDTMQVGDVPVFDITPDRVDFPGVVQLDIHGGALIMGAGECCRAMATLAATGTRMHTWSVDYRMPPDHPYPAALDDCIAVYRALLEVSPSDRVVVSGASAGGNLAAALLVRAHDEGLPLPAALVLLSPEVDLTESGDSFSTNLGIDSVLTRRLADANALYAGDHDLAHPYLSPLFGDVASFPPTFLQTGTRDLFLSNTVRMHRALRAAGVDAELHVFEAMPHGGFWGAPEDREITDEVRRFVAAHVAG